ncbi:MAG: hypothetical protein RID25_05155 [Cyclobacteriaceae bacterium]
MSKLEGTESFKQAEKRLLELKKKLEHRIDRTAVAMKEVKKINEEIVKLRKRQRSGSKRLFRKVCHK